MIRLTTLGAFGKKEETPKPVNESRTKLVIKNQTIEFVVQVNNGRLVLLPNSNGIDSIKELGMSEREVYSSLSDLIGMKTKIHFEKDRSYKGAGYGFVIDGERLKKLLR